MMTQQAKPTDPVLVVEDTDDSREVMGTLLEMEGYRVAYATDGRDALDKLETGLKPCLILLDVSMPRMNGIELLAEIRKQPSLQMLPVVMMTSSNQPRDVAAGYAAGANGFVVKPVGFEKLVESAKAIGTFWGIFNRPAASDAAFP